MNYDDICMYVVNKQFELLEFVFPFIMTCSIIRFNSLLLLGLYLCDICSHMVVLGLSVRWSWYLVWCVPCL